MKINRSSGRARSHRHTALRGNKGESGIALIIALICLLVLSVLAGAMIFATQSEMWTTNNFRTVTQARYAAEAGAQLAVDWLQNNWQPPTTPAFTDATFDRTSFPVKYQGTNIVLNGGAIGIGGTYSFDSTTETSFKNLFYPSGKPATISVPSSAPAGFNPAYTVSAQLLEAEPVAGTSGWVTSWKVFSQGTVGKAKVQLVEVVNKVITTTSSPKMLFKNGVVALSNACGAITMSGGSVLNAYDSLASGKNHTIFNGTNQCGQSGDPSKANCANVATPGSVVLTGSTSVQGIVTSLLGGSTQIGKKGTPCPSTYAVNWSGGPVVPNGAVDINTVTTFPAQPPVNIPAGIPANTAACVDPDRNSALLPNWAKGTLDRCNGGSNVGTVTLTNGTSWNSNNMTLNPNPSGNYGNVYLGASTVLNITQSGTYNFNSLHVGNGASISVAPGVSVTINIIGASPTFNGTNALLFDGNGQMITADAAKNVLIQYNGNLPIVYSGSGGLVGVINAPNAAFNYSGAGITYGAIVSNTTVFSGSGVVQYDVDLGRNGIPTGNSVLNITPMHVDQFSWSVY